MDSMRLSELHPHFLRDLLARGASTLTIAAYKSDFAILKTYAGDDLRNLTPEKMSGYAAWLAERRALKTRGARGHSPRGIARRMDSASSFCKWMVRARHIRRTSGRHPAPKRPAGSPSSAR